MAIRAKPPAKPDDATGSQGRGRFFKQVVNVSGTELMKRRNISLLTYQTNDTEGPCTGAMGVWILRLSLTSPSLPPKYLCALEIISSIRRPIQNKLSD